MGLVDLTDLADDLDIRTADFSYANTFQTGETVFRYFTQAGHLIDIRGTGFSYNISGIPEAGTITSVTIEMQGTDPNVPDIAVTGLSADLSDIVINGSLESARSFWKTVMSGETEILPPTDTSHFLLIGADGGNIVDGIVLGNDSTISGTFGGSASVRGGLYELEGGIYQGGTLTFDGHAFTVVGDVSFLSSPSSTVIGGDDHITVSGDSTQIYGDIVGFNDGGSLYGGDDFIDARGAGSDLIYGDFYESSGDSTAIGGNDTIYTSNTGSSMVFGDAEVARVDGYIVGGDDTIYGGDGDSSIYGDWLGQDRETAIGGNDLLYTGAGDDTVSGNGGNDRIFITGATGANTLYGGDGDDLIKLVDADLDEVIAHGGDGIDRLSLYNYDRRVEFDMEEQTQNIGISGFENLTTSNTNGDTIATVAGEANDVDTVGGNDTVFSRGGGDKISLGAGNDLVRAGLGENTYEGGSGLDTITYSQSAEGVRVDLRDDEASGGDAEGDTISSFERVNGSNGGNDLLLGTNGGNVMKGLDGDDRMSGRDGTDKMYGGDGEDYLDAGADRDTMFGGDGVDTFHIDKGHDVDIIADFENNVDRIELDVAADFDWRDNATQRSDGVLINLGDGDLLLVEDALIGQLTNDLILV